MKIFIVSCYSFCSKDYPAHAFLNEGTRDKLLMKSSPGDLLLLAATTGTRTEKGLRGRLLGVGEIGREAKKAEELISKETLKHPRNINSAGNFRWPFAVQIIKAWRFKNQPLTNNTLEDRSKYSTLNAAPQLSKRDQAIIMAIWENESEIEEISLSKADAPGHEEGAAAALSPSRGPAPSSGERSYEVAEHDFGYVYWLQFGRRDVWKIGRANDPQERLHAINANIPHLVTGEKWEIVAMQKTDSPEQAHDLEQKAIQRLRKSSIGGEMFRCSRKQFEKAWLDIVVADATGHNE